jgi:hypothetical protein
MMPIPKNPNIALLEAAVERLGPLINEVVFLGGCATGLFLTDSAAPPLRVTRDVDVMVDVASLTRYHRFNEKLREQGFVEDTSPEAPICRWHSENIILDVMPTNPELLGFGNIWFAQAFSAAQYLSLPSGARIRVLPPSYFIATKIAAFDHRGAGDLLLSRDVEDLVTVLDGRSEIVHEVQNTEPELLTYIAKRFEEWLNATDFRDALPGLLPPDAASQARGMTIIERMEMIVGHAEL